MSGVLSKKDVVLDVDVAKAQRIAQRLDAIRTTVAKEAGTTLGLIAVLAIAKAAGVYEAEALRAERDRLARELEFLTILADGAPLAVNGIPWREAFERLNNIVSDPVALAEGES